MTKEEFQKEMAYYSRTDSVGESAHAFEMGKAKEYRAFDPQLATLIETASSAWAEVFRYIRKRMRG